MLVQPKVDEVRCRVYRLKSSGKVLFESYAQKPLHNLGAWGGLFAVAFDRLRVEELDIGVLVNGNFNDSYRWVRSSRGIPEGLCAEQVQFILFDDPTSPLDYAMRVLLMRRYLQRLHDVGLPMHDELPLITAECEQDVDDAYAQFRAQGYEGAMIKTLDHQYVRTRSAAWLKYKPKDTADGKIVRVLEAHSEAGEPLGRAGAVQVECEDGSGASPAGIAHTLGRELWANQEQYVGRWCEFEYMERDRAGGYRHPRFVRLREAK